MQPTSPPLSQFGNVTYDLIDDYTPAGLTQPAAEPAQSEQPSIQTLVEYPNRMLLERIVDTVSAVTTTGARLVDGYRTPNRLVVMIANTNQIPQRLLDTIAWMYNYQGFRLKSQHVFNYMTYLEATVRQKFEIIKEPLILKADTNHTPSYFMDLKNLEYKSSNTFKPDILFIPFLYPRHIVMIEVNFTERMIYYYDSQGIPPQDSCRKVYEGFDMPLELEKLKSKAFGKSTDVKIIYNRYVHQQDCHSCGVYSCDYIERRLAGESFEQIDTHGKDAAMIERERLAQGLKLSKFNLNPDEIL